MVNMQARIQMTPGERIKTKIARKIGVQKRPGIRVVPKNDVMRRLLKHQPSGLAFRSEGGMEWPDDTFTRKRIRDGSVTVEVEEPKPEVTAGRSRRGQEE